MIDDKEIELALIELAVLKGPGTETAVEHIANVLEALKRKPSQIEAIKELRRDLMRFEALPPQSPGAVWEWAQKAYVHVGDMLRANSQRSDAP